MKYVISFDVVEDRIRYQVVKVLREYGYRVQKSVFEGYYSQDEIKECKKKRYGIINCEEDSVRFYPLCKKCETEVGIQGIGKKIEELDYIIV